MKKTIHDLQKEINTEIIRRGRILDDCAKHDAVEFARKPDDEKARHRAEMSVSRADSLGSMASDLTEKVNWMFSAFIQQDKQ